MSEQIITEFDVAATMRDGVVLRANIFRPADEGSYPVALTRTPYGKDYATVTPFLDATRLARAGYIVVIQDTRGRFRSEGEWVAQRNEAEDGYDTVEWAAKLPGSNGKVGMSGASYFGYTQYAAARLQPPSLKALVPSITWADMRDGTTWRGGALELGLFAGWSISTVALDTVLKQVKDAPPAQKFGAVVALVNEINRLRTEGYFSLPLKDFEPFKKLGLSLQQLQELIEHANEREYYAPISPYEHYDKIQVPTLSVGGWYDIFTQGTLQNFTAFRTEGSTPEARQARLVMGPWSHVNYSNTVGEQDFGFAAQMALMNMQTDLTGLTQRWFDYWLKGVETGITKEPPVKLFIMGENVWRDEQEWPLARTQYTPYYLHTSSLLSTEKPGSETIDQYRYDPSDPTPTLGGNILMNALFAPGVKDQRTIEARPDVISYTSEPLTQDTEVTGRIVVKLWASSDAPDTDFVARLVDVHPDGFARNLADGIIRARYRNGEKPELMKPGQVYEFTIDLWSTANLFKAGHSIRLDITSSCFPRWDRNLNTGAAFGTDFEPRVAQQIIYHDAEHPSQVVLPIIPR